MSSQLSALSSQRTQAEGACQSPRKTDLTQRRRDAETQRGGIQRCRASASPLQGQPQVGPGLGKQASLALNRPFGAGFARPRRTQSESELIVRARNIDWLESGCTRRVPRREKADDMNVFMEVVFFPTRADEVRGRRARHEHIWFLNFVSLRLCASAFFSYRVLPLAPKTSEALWL